MSDIERALARDSVVAENRAQAEKQVIINDLNDIKSVLSKFDPSNDIGDNKQVSTTLNVDNLEYAVNTTTKPTSMRRILIEGIKTKRRHCITDSNTEPISINGKDVNPPKMVSGGKSMVDTIVKKWTGGYLSGDLICWDLDDGYRYSYDIFNHKLTRSRTNNG